MSARYRPLAIAMVLLLLASLAAALAPRAVSAHAFLQRTQPANGTIVAPNIGEVRLTFNEPVEVRPERISVTGSDGKRYDLRDARQADGDPTTAVVSLPQLPNGVFTARYALLSSDTHPINGTLRFGVGVSPADVLAGAPATQETGLTGAVLLQAAGRWLNLLGLVLLLGPIVFRFFVLTPFRLRDRGESGDAAVPLFEARNVRWAWIGVVVLIAGLVVSLAAASIASSLGTAAEALQPATLAATLNGRFGTLWLARLALLLVPALALPVIGADHELGEQEAGEDESDEHKAAPVAPAGRGRGGWLAILASGAALALLTSLGGHPASTTPVPLTVLVDWAHLLATMAWIGGLLALAFILPGVVRALGDGGTATLAGVVPRFSALALVAIQMLVVTGLYQAWAHVDGPATIGASTYGRTLVVKLLLLIPLLGLAALNRFVILPRLCAVSGDDAAAADKSMQSPAVARRLWRTAWGETALAIIVLGVVGVLTALPPARIQAADDTAPGPNDTAAPVGTTLAGSAGTLLVNLTIGPTGNGPAVITVTLRDPQGNSVDDAAVTLRATPPDGGAPSEVKLDPKIGRYTGLLDAGKDGLWKLDTVVASRTEAPATATFSLQIPTGGAATLLAGADAAMNRLTSLRERQTIGAGGPAVTTDYEWSAPDRLHLRADTGSETIVIGKRRFDRSGNSAWLPSDWPEAQGYRWPQFVYAKTAAEVTLLGQEEIGGVNCWVITFLDTTADARYTLWIGQGDSLIRQQRMYAVGHYMQSTFSDFNTPIAIEAPQ